MAQIVFGSAQVFGVTSHAAFLTFPLITMLDLHIVSNSEELELRNVLSRALSYPADLMSIASSDTLSTCPSPVPYGSEYGPAIDLPEDLAEPILVRVIGKHLHEWVESSMTLRETRLGSSFDPWFREFWAPVANLMLVSSTFHDLVSRLVCIAFDVHFPFVRNGIAESVVHQVHNKLRSLFYFGSAILYDALQAPPAGWPPLVKAYGNYIIVLKYRPWHSSHGMAVPPMNMAKVCEDLYVHLHTCYGQGLPIFFAEDLVQGARGDKVPNRGALTP